MKNKTIKHKKTRIKSRRKKFSLFSIVISLLVMVAIVAYFFRLFTPAPIEIAELVSSTGTVNLSLSATSNNLELEESTTITLSYESLSQQLTGIVAEISYDPSLVLPTAVTPGEDFPSLIMSPVIADGLIKFAIGVPAGQGGGLTGTGTVATFTLTAQNPGEAELAIGSNTQITAYENGGQQINALREITNTTISIVDPNVVPSPSPSPQDSPLPSTEPSPSPSSSPSPSPSSSPIAKPSQPTNLRYNCYEGGNKITLRWDQITGVSSYELTFNQVDGDTYDIYRTLSGTEVNLDIHPNTKFNWHLRSVKSGVKSDEARVDNITCSGTLSNNTTSSPSPSPSLQPSTTPIPTKKPSLVSKIIQSISPSKAPSPTPKPSSVSIATLPSTSPSSTLITPEGSPGSLFDIFASPEPDTEQATLEPGLFMKIWLGWKALIQNLIAIVAP